MQILRWAQGVNLEIGVDYTGGNLVHAAGESPADCCVCAAMEECKYFSYKARQCYYKSSMNGRTKNDYLVTNGSPPTERRTSMGVL